MLFVGEKDLRDLPLVERKARLRALLKPKMERALYVDHVEEHGTELFRLACERDLEGIVAKHRRGRYVSERERSSWIKIKNPGTRRPWARTSILSGWRGGANGSARWQNWQNLSLLK